jgi:hypothetical protein
MKFFLFAGLLSLAFCADNDIKGPGNVVKSGTDNHVNGQFNTLEGFKNFVSGKLNDIQGDSNEVEGNQN